METAEDNSVGFAFSFSADSEDNWGIDQGTHA